MTEDNFHDQDLYPTGKIVDLHYHSGETVAMKTVVITAWGERMLHVTDLYGRLQSFTYSSIQRLTPND